MFDLFLAGSETTSTYLAYLLMYSVNFPAVQKRVQEEIDRVVGRSRIPSLTDKEELPYTNAFIYEVLRHANITPFSGAKNALFHLRIVSSWTNLDQSFSQSLPIIFQ